MPGLQEVHPEDPLAPKEDDECNRVDEIYMTVSFVAPRTPRIRSTSSIEKGELSHLLLRSGGVWQLRTTVAVIGVPINQRRTTSENASVTNARQ